MPGNDRHENGLCEVTWTKTRFHLYLEVNVGDSLICGPACKRTLVEHDTVHHFISLQTSLHSEMLMWRFPLWNDKHCRQCGAPPELKIFRVKSHSTWTNMHSKEKKETNSMKCNLSAKIALPFANILFWKFVCWLWLAGNGENKRDVVRFAAALRMWAMCVCYHQ